MAKQKGSSKAVYIAAFLLLALGVGYLAISGIQSGSVYFLNVSEALAKGVDNIEQARLFGKVKSQGLEQSQEQIGVRFQLADKDDPGQTIWVNYQGVVPDSFQPGVEVIVEGSSSQAGKEFLAHSLMTKCPSKYEEQEQN
ncbi:MAG: cytochrome c maturation protein CcmE [Thermodesulfobacteriota bacterium]